MRGCPACGAALRPLPELYAEEVRRVDGDPERLGRLAPPTNRSAIHGFIMGVLIWISLLLPFFVHSHFWRAALPTWGVTLLWVGLFAGARGKDRRLQAAHARREGCPACGWIGD